MAAPAPSTRYSCGFNGTCEPNPQGDYLSLTDCQADCQGRPSADLNYLIYEYAPDAAVTDLTPSDQRRVLAKLTGIDSPDPAYVAELLTALGDLQLAYSYPDLWPYFEARGELIDALVCSGRPEALARLIAILQPSTLSAGQAFALLLTQGMEAVCQAIYDLGKLYSAFLRGIVQYVERHHLSLTEQEMEALRDYMVTILSWPNAVGTNTVFNLLRYFTDLNLYLYLYEVAERIDREIDDPRVSRNHLRVFGAAIRTGDLPLLQGLIDRGLIPPFGFILQYVVASNNLEYLEAVLQSGLYDPRVVRMNGPPREYPIAFTAGMRELLNTYGYEISKKIGD